MVTMRMNDLQRGPVIHQVMEQTITQGKAGTLVGRTARQIRRLIERGEPEGEQGLAHRGRGRPSNRRIPETVTATGLTLPTQHYGDFGPTLTTEKRAERHGITLSAETLQ